MRALTEKQEKFVAGLIAGLTQRQAYRDAYACAGASDRTVDRAALSLMNNARVRARHEELCRRVAREAEAIVTAKRVLRELAGIAFADIADYANIVGDEVILTPTKGIAPEKRAAIAGIKQGVRGIELKLHDKVRPLELIGKYLSMWNERVEVDADVNYTFEGDYAE